MSAFASFRGRCMPLAGAVVLASGAVAQSHDDAATAQAFLDTTCIQCHSEEAESAMALFSGFFLDRLDLADVAAHPAEWEKVVRKLRTGMMPPASEPRPDEAQRQAFMAYLEGELDALAVRSPNPGRPALHRLNRTEYENAIRDLLALDIDAKELLPGDDASFGFDNVAGSLGVSPVLVERYANAAARIARLAVGDLGIDGRAEDALRAEFPDAGGAPRGAAVRHARGAARRAFFPARRRLPHQRRSHERRQRHPHRQRRAERAARGHARRPARGVVRHLEAAADAAGTRARAAEAGRRGCGAAGAGRAAGGRKRGEGRREVGSAHSRQRGAARARRRIHQEEPRLDRGHRPTAEQHVAAIRCSTARPRSR